MRIDSLEPRYLSIPSRYAFASCSRSHVLKLQRIHVLGVHFPCWWFGNSPAECFSGSYAEAYACSHSHAIPRTRSQYRNTTGIYYYSSIIKNNVVSWRGGIRSPGGIPFVAWTTPNWAEELHQRLRLCILYRMYKLSGKRWLWLSPSRFVWSHTSIHWQDLEHTLEQTFQRSSAFPLPLQQGNKNQGSQYTKSSHRSLVKAWRKFHPRRTPQSPIIGWLQWPLESRLPPCTNPPSLNYHRHIFGIPTSSHLLIIPKPLLLHTDQGVYETTSKESCLRIPSTAR